MDVDLVVQEAVADLEVQERLAQEFPGLPAGLIGSVLAAYRRRRVTRMGALSAARRQLRAARPVSGGA